jgi:hypothetical protein
VSLGLITHGSDVRELHRNSQRVGKTAMRDMHLIEEGPRAQVQ